MSASNELQQLATHAHAMAAASHSHQCGTWSRGWIGVGTHRPDPACPGCVTVAERFLWSQIANEIDTYLTAPANDDEPLWENA